MLSSCVIPVYVDALPTMALTEKHQKKAHVCENNLIRRADKRRMNEDFNIAAQDSNPGSRSRESEALPLSHGALHYSWPVEERTCKTKTTLLCVKITLSVQFVQTSAFPCGNY